VDHAMIELYRERHGGSFLAYPSVRRAKIEAMSRRPCNTVMISIVSFATR
jgi:hypothetical protein